MLTIDDLTSLTKDLPSIAVVTTIPMAPLEKLASALEKSGAKIYMFNLYDKVKLYSYYNTALKNRVVPTENGKTFFNKAKVIQNIFLKKHPNMNNTFEYSFCDEQLNVPLQKEKFFQGCELCLLGPTAMFIDADKFSATLQGKKTIMFCPTCGPFTGFCHCTAGCKKWQQHGCEDCPVLGRTHDDKDMCAKFFAYKKTGYADARDLIVVTPSRWLNREIRHSILGKNFFNAVIPTNVKLDIFRPIPQEEARERLGVPRDRPVILTGSAGLRKNKGGHLLCEALRQLDGHWSHTPPRVLVFGQDAPFITRLREHGLEADSLGWIDDMRTLAAVYAAADVFVSPSFQDNLPNTVNEALACGTPVICFDRFSSEDVVIDGVTGFLARHPGLPLSPEGELLQPAPYEPEPERCADLATKILQFFELPPWRREDMRLACRLMAESTFDPVRETANYLQLFRNMLKLPYISLH